MVGGGYLFGRLARLCPETMVRSATDFFLPMLVLHSLYTMDSNAAEVGRVAAACLTVLALLLAVAALYVRLSGAEGRSLIPAVIFMTPGFLGVPVMKLWAGASAVSLVIVYDQIQTLSIFTLGMLIIVGGFSVGGLREARRAPLLWSIVAGFLLHFLRVPLPALLLQALAFGSAAAPALAAFALG